MNSEMIFIFLHISSSILPSSNFATSSFCVSFFLFLSACLYRRRNHDYSGQLLPLSYLKQDWRKNTEHRVLLRDVRILLTISFHSVFLKTGVVTQSDAQVIHLHRVRTRNKVWKERNIFPKHFYSMTRTRQMKDVLTFILLQMIHIFNLYFRFFMQDLNAA